MTRTDDRSPLPLMRLGLVLLLILVPTLTTGLWATESSDGVWRDIDEKTIQARGARQIVPLRYRTVTLDLAAVEQVLAAAPLEGATDLTVINVTDQQIVVREAVVSELALPTGNTKEYLEAYRSEVDENSKISEFLSGERWKGFKPPPIPEK